MKNSNPAHKIRRLISFISLTLFTQFYGIAFGQAHKTAIMLNGVYHDLPTVKIADSPNFEFIALKKLAKILKTYPIVSQKTHKAIFHLGDTEIKVTALNPFVILDNTIKQMPVATAYKNGEIFLPLPFFVDLISPFFPGQLTSVGNRQLAAATVSPAQSFIADITPDPAVLLPSSPAHSNGTKIDSKTEKPPLSKVTAIYTDEKANGTLIRIKTSSVIQQTHINSRSTRGWLYIDIFGTTVDTLNVFQENKSSFIQEIRPVQLPQMAQLSFRMSGTLDSKKIFSNPKTREILVSLTTREQISADIIKTLEDERKKWLIDTIILDPGHGGRDPGAIGPRGTYEKNITLAIARHLKSIIDKETDMRVVMTRQNDRFISLKERTKLANREQGKLFISIHANSNRNRRVRGLTTYLLGAARTEEAIESARRENAVIRYESDSTSYADFNTENYILASMAQNSYQQESEEFAALMQDEISQRASVKNRGVKQAGYYVLIGASMPNVLIETGFISNREEEKRLNSYQFQKKIAHGIFEGIIKFKTKYESGI